MELREAKGGAEPTAGGMGGARSFICCERDCAIESDSDDTVDADEAGNDDNDNDDALRNLCCCI